MGGYKVFHFGCDSSYKGRWLTAGSEPGFHVWLNLESARSYQKRLGGGEVLPVHFTTVLSAFSELDGPAVTAERLFIH